jgi:hypothetical protein
MKGIQVLKKEKFLFSETGLQFRINCIKSE